METEIAAVVLAGGRSRRMGGVAKFLLPFAGSTMLDHVLARLAGQVSEIAISANVDPAVLVGFGHPVIADGEHGRAGPLAGVLAGMDWAHSHGRGHLLSVASDTPFFPEDLAFRLVEAAGVNERRIVVARSRDRIHPVFALWPVSLRKELSDFLRRVENRRVTDFIYAHDWAAVSFADEHGRDPFFNANTPAELMEADRMSRKTG